MICRFLSPREERALKRSIPWNSIDRKINECVRIANQIDGVATLQSCEGHVNPTKDGFSVDSASICFRATYEITLKVLFVLAPRIGIRDVALRFFPSGSFWISLSVYPSERGKLFRLFSELEVK